MSQWVVTIAAQAFAELRAHGERDYPNEACGLLIGKSSVDGIHLDEARPMKNLNTERARDRYILDPKDHLEADGRARAEGRDILGIYHSHPDHPALPSEFDRAHAYPEMVYVIVSVREGRAEGVGTFMLVDWNGTFANVPHEVS